MKKNKDLEIIKNKINEFLKDRNQLEDVDTTLIEEFIFNIELINQCKDDIREEGYKINITTHEGKQDYWVKSQSFIAYQSCLKNINTILISLGLTPRERAKFKMALGDLDNFDKIMNS
jgi:P27 family predicted phage terminase small subunit